MKVLKSLATMGLLGSAVVMSHSANGAGADINHSGLAGAIGKYGPINGIHAYVLGSNTCNLGDASLSWINRGTPALAMNAYRLHNGRLEQIGVGNAKTACCVANSGNALCGTSCSTSGFGLRAGCMDTYGAGFNAGQGRLAPRSFINPQTGAVSTAYSNTTGDAIYRRLQVLETDMNPATYPGAQFFVEGHYVCTEDRQAGNDINNCSYQRVTLGATYGMTAAGTFNIGRAAIFAWQDHGGGAGVPDPNVVIQNVDVPGEGRFYVASKVTPNGNGTWHYEYAIHNLNSDRAASSFRVPLPVGAVVSNAGFHDVWYHDEDAIYDGTDWVQPVSTFEVRWSTAQTYTQNVNANAIRWGTMYNFWFDCDRAPVNGQAEIDLFKPINPPPAPACQAVKVGFGVRVPGAACDSDITRNGQVDILDLLDVINRWGPCACTVNCPSNVETSGGNTNVDTGDLLKIITTWGGCP